MGFPRFLLLAFGTCILVGVVSSRPLEKAPPAQIGLSADRLEEITRYLQMEVDEGRIAAAVGLVARHGQIGYFESVGECDKDSLFRLASMTKAVTTVAVMQLFEEGLIALNDPVSKYIPAFAQAKVIDGDRRLRDVEKVPTIHHLLTHTSGIGYGWGEGPQDERYREVGLHDMLVPVKETIEERVKKIAHLPLAFQPGEQWMYGLSLDVLGRVVEIVSDLTLEQYFQERIFRPLGMKNTTFDVDEEQRENLAPLYAPGPGGSLVEVGSEVLSAGTINYSADFPFEDRNELYAGGSGLVGTTMDYARFLQMLLNRGNLGGGTILKPSSVDLMTQNHIGDLTIAFPGHGDGFGYGFGVLTERGKADDVASVGTYSWGGIFNTYYWVDPQEELVGLVMMQIFPNDHLPIRQDFKQLVYDTLDDSGFARRYWYEQGAEHGNPYFNPRQLRVNSAGVGAHSVFAERSEVRSSGLARILVEEDLRALKGASLYCEIWGGHPGTHGKRVSINGRTEFPILDTGTADNQCTHSYPRFCLAPTDLVNGYNSVQFACVKEGDAWGHFIVENAAIDIRLPENDVRLLEVGLGQFAALVNARPRPKSEIVEIGLETDDPSVISHVVYEARYYGYDENGNGWETDWHGMTKEREPYGQLGKVASPPFALKWDVSMLPAQPDVAIRATVHFRDRPDLIYQTPILGGFEVPERENARVSLVTSDDLPKPFWSRANRKKECTLRLDAATEQIEEAELHVVAWTGGAGEVEKYFILNDTFLPVAEGHSHETVYSVFPIEASLLKRGENKVALVSDTEHHGIEILLPGPALMIRSRVN